MNQQVVVYQNSVRSTYLFRAAYLKALLEKGYSVSVVARADDVDASVKLKKLGCNLKLITTADGLWGFLWYVVFMNWQYLKYNFFNKKPKNCIHFVSVAVVLAPSIWLMCNKNNWVSIEGLGSFANSKYKLNFVRFLLNKRNILLTFTNEDELFQFKSQRSVLLGGIGLALRKYNVDRISNRNEIGYFGRLVKDKGFDDVILLAREIKKRSLPLSVVVYGEIYPNNPSSLSERELKSLDVELGDYLKFCGFTKNVNHAFKTVACLVLPSKREGFPVVVMEASACGVPSICYRVPGCEDAIVEGLNGYLVTVGDRKALIETVISVALASSDDREKFSVRCRQYALQNFDEQKYVEKVLSIVAKL